MFSSSKKQSEYRNGMQQLLEWYETPHGEETES